MTRPAVLAALSLACLGAALCGPLHPATWLLFVLAAVFGGAASVAFITLAHALEPLRDPGPVQRWPIHYPDPDDLDAIHADLGLPPRDGDER